MHELQSSVRYHVCCCDPYTYLHSGEPPGDSVNIRGPHNDNARPVGALRKAEVFNRVWGLGIMMESVWFRA